jgi:hypothetical protein
MNRIYFLFFILICSFQGCIVPQFLEPQPAGVKDKKYFPEKLRGRYSVTLLNMIAQPGNQSSITIDSTRLNLYEVKKVKSALSDVKADTGIMLLDGYIYLLERAEAKAVPYKLINDTIYYTDSSRVELNLSGNCIFREWKGHYFLNRKREKYWDVLLIDHQKDNSYAISALVIAEKTDESAQFFSDPFVIPIDSFYHRKAPPVTPKPKTGKKSAEHLCLEDLEKITPYKKESTEYIINPSKAQLNKLVKRKFFKEVWRMERTKTNSI